MQPYFFPYLGYFHLIKSVDKFIFFDDVDYINRGWINRNRILLNNSDHLITVPVSNGSQNSKINQVLISEDSRLMRKLNSTLGAAYAKAPYKTTILELFNESLSGQKSISEAAEKSVQLVLNYLGIRSNSQKSSDGYDNAYLKGQDRILDICLKERANSYHNLIGGKDLYSRESFMAKGIDLKFICSEFPAYNQSSPEFMKGLSIIDILMNCSISDICSMMDEYRIEGSD